MIVVTGVCGKTLIQMLLTKMVSLEPSTYRDFVRWLLVVGQQQVGLKETTVVCQVTASVMDLLVKVVSRLLCLVVAAAVHLKGPQVSSK